MNVQTMLAMILISAIITFFLRAFPFLAFSGTRKMPQVLERLGKMLPSVLMAILVIYCLKDIPYHGGNAGISKIPAALCTGLSYKWKHNTFLSILLGTALYMLLLRI